VEHAGWEEDLEVGGWRRALTEDRTLRRRTRRRRGTRRVRGWTTRGGGDGSALGSTSTHLFRRIHLIRHPIAPCDDNKVVIIPCCDG
jgi:hypothetical protein